VQGFARHVRKADGPALVSAQKLAEHLGCVRSYVRKLVEAGVVEQRADGRYDRDQCRERYIAHLRAERRQSPKSAADTEFTAAKAELIRIRIGEQKRELVRQSDVDELIDSMMGVVLTALSSLPARCAPRGDLVTRRHIERAVIEVRSELAAIARRKAEEAGEPSNVLDVAMSPSS